MAPAAPNCPTNYWWTETNDPRVRVARKVVKDTEHDKQFPELQDGEMLAITSKDLQQDYAFHRLGKTVETWMVDQTSGIEKRAWELKSAPGLDRSPWLERILCIL